MSTEHPRLRLVPPIPRPPVPTPRPIDPERLRRNAHLFAPSGPVVSMWGFKTMRRLLKRRAMGLNKRRKRSRLEVIKLEYHLRFGRTSLWHMPKNESPAKLRVQIAAALLSGVPVPGWDPKLYPPK